MRIELNEVLAHRVSPALFTLDDAGALGVRAIDQDNRVVFYAVDVIEDTPEGAWVTGLPSAVNLITVGQEFVLVGQLVDPVYVGARADLGIKVGSVGSPSPQIDVDTSSTSVKESTLVSNTAPLGSTQ